MKEEDLMGGLMCASALFFPLRKTVTVSVCVFQELYRDGLFCLNSKQNIVEDNFGS